MSRNESAPHNRPSLPVVVVLGGAAPSVRAPALMSAIERGARVIAADRGADHAHSLGLRVDVAVGDFDSVSEAGLAEVAASGGRTERHPTAKDATDLELALDLAARMGATEILVVGGPPSSRLDHFVANLSCLTSARWHDIDVRARLGDLDAIVIPPGGRRRWTVAVGQIVTLLAYGGRAVVRESSGLEWPTESLTLDPGSSHGVSNRADDTSVDVAVATGTVLALVPDDEGT